MKIAIIASVLTISLLSGCAIQGTDSLTPGGVTLNRSVRLGVDAFKPNPFERPPEPRPLPEPPPQPPVVVENRPIIVNNHYPAPRYSFQTFEPRQENIIILESYE